ncbi:MAG: arsenic resistance N-acetyltransferase ArsN2 [Candidatus Bathyarchaeia archaeon]
MIKPTAPEDKAEQSMNKPEPTFKIRSAQLHDQKIIRTLLSVFKLPLDGLEETKLWVLQSSNGEVVGVAGLEVYDNQGLLRSVAVIKSMHNQGYGTSLASYVIGEAKRSHVRNLFLLTTTASAFFKKLGFKEESREKVAGSITNSVEFKSACPKTAILMRLPMA